MALSEDKSAKLKELENKVITLDGARKKAKNHQVDRDGKLKTLTTLISKRTTDAVETRLGCYDLYVEMYKSRRHVPTIPQNDTECQLAYIRQSIAYHQDVYATAQQIKQLQLAGAYNHRSFLRDRLKRQ